jgi:hypothetical protein
MDLHIGTVKGNNSTTLLVACGPPGIGAKIRGNVSENKSGITYTDTRRVACTSAVMNLEITIAFISDCNSTALEVACSPPGIGAK